jgi:hypothetical protein
MMTLAALAKYLIVAKADKAAWDLGTTHSAVLAPLHPFLFR